jgi:phosphotransferase system HPr (HPr) family protein
MPDVTLELRNPSGLHARPASMFAKAAAGFSSEITIVNLTRDADKSASAKSILGVLGAGVSKGHSIRITAEGGDAEEAIRTLTELIESGLGEPVEP